MIVMEILTAATHAAQQQIRMKKKIRISNAVEELREHAISDEHADTRVMMITCIMFYINTKRPWAATYVALFFFLGISLLVLTFYAIQRVAQAGWSIVVI